MMDQSTDAESSLIKPKTPAVYKKSETMKISAKKLMENGDWICSGCTLVNKESLQACELCDSRRDASKKSDAKWTCGRCTYKNNHSSQTCYMCNYNKDSETNKTTLKNARTTLPCFSNTPIISNLSNKQIKTPESKANKKLEDPISPVILSSTPQAKRKLTLKAESERERRLRICREKQQELRKRLVNLLLINPKMLK